MRPSASPGLSSRPSEFDRARLLDMTRLVLPASLFASALCGIAVATLVGQIGLILLAPFALGAGGQLAIGFLFPRMSHPARWILAGDCLSVLSITWGIALTGGLRSPGLVFLILPLIAVAGRHTLPVVAGFAVFCLLAPLLASLVAINHGIDYGGVRVLATFAAIVGAGAMTVELLRAERHFRQQSLLDPLTGVLNRLALERRFEELSAQAVLSGDAVCLIAADVDEFKAINDNHGHDVGDVVLRDVAYALRTALRAFSLLYRTGGEEFVAILPGLDSHQGTLVAERLRAGVQESRPRGIEVTSSFGVASASGAEVDYKRLLACADERLYEAKRAGRNRVVGAMPPAPLHLTQRPSPTDPRLASPKVAATGR
jgi:diguanylate cyclase (GGDEF)-like protein